MVNQSPQSYANRISCNICIIFFTVKKPIKQLFLSTRKRNENEKQLQKKFCRMTSDRRDNPRIYLTRVLNSPSRGRSRIRLISQINDAEPRTRAGNWSDGGVARTQRRLLGQRCIRAAAVWWPIGARACACTHLEGIPTPHPAPDNPPTYGEGLFSILNDRSWGEGNDALIGNASRVSTRERSASDAAWDRSFWSIRGRRIGGAIQTDNYDEQCTQAKRHFARK